MTTIRPYREGDRAAVEGLGLAVIDWWNQGAALHLVAGGPPVAHLQAVDLGTVSARRTGQCHMRLVVAPAHRGRGIGGALFERALAFAQERGAEQLQAAYTEQDAHEPAIGFLRRRGFKEFERYYPSHLDVDSFDPGRFAALAERLEQEGISFFTYADEPDAAESRRRLFELECAARADQPFRGVAPFVAPPFEEWEATMRRWDPTTIFLARAGSEWIGVVTGLVWGFTGVRPEFRGRGIATALKVRAIERARVRGMTRIQTENHQDNAAMLTVNRRLGFVFDAPEVACVKWLGDGPQPRC
jgi:GNAT superfamily N-acetyltransferase